jgi:hypothetical protein
MAPPTEVRFELQRLALQGDELVVSGFWTGVRGMRFVRPTLLCEDRRILATLEHKPWAPSDDAPWTAAFPWTGGDAVDAVSLALAVAPRVIVPLGETTTDAPAAAKAAKPARAAKPAKATAAAQAMSATEPVPAANPTPVPTPPVIPVDARSDDLARALAAVERERDRAIAQRDEVLIAYTALQRQLRTEHAQADRHARDRKDRGGTDPDAPLGVRTVPAVRDVLAELQYPPREPKRRLAAFDLWVVRVIGLAAAGCFLALLLSIVRVVS